MGRLLGLAVRVQLFTQIAQASFLGLDRIGEGEGVKTLRVSINGVISDALPSTSGIGP
jgi:hypothetical protein